MSKEQRFEFRVEDSVWAILRISEHGKILEHDLSELQLAVCPGFAVFDEKGQKLKISQGDQLYLSEPSGAICLKLEVSDSNDETVGDIVDVVDPKRKAHLVVNLVGPGSTGSQPIRQGGLVLNLRPA